MAVRFAAANTGRPGSGVAADEATAFLLVVEGVRSAQAVGLFVGGSSASLIMSPKRCGTLNEIARDRDSQGGSAEDTKVAGFLELMGSTPPAPFEIPTGEHEGNKNERP